MRIISFFVLLALFYVFRSWFIGLGTLSSGDWPYLFLENIKEFSFFPEIRFLWLAPYYQISTKIFVQYLGMPWEIVERFLWFFPFIALSVLSSFYLTRSWIGVLLYTTNTYILMVVSGGQMGVALAYSIVPFVLKKFFDFVDPYFSEGKFKIIIQNSKRLKRSIILGLILSVLTMLDPRIAYITMIAIVLYTVLSIWNRVWRISLINIFYFILYTLIVPLTITFVLNTYWIIPILLYGIPQEHRGVGSIAGFEFLSFTDFPHALSFLHPNWPENIFGKTYFLQPEFLMLPILAYSSLLFLNSKLKSKNSKLQLKTQNIKIDLTMEQWNNRAIAYFVLLGLLGAFLAKGANEPFGQLNSFLFQYFPGMSMFRDSTKFYLLIALSYSVLIPFSLQKVFEWIQSRTKFSTFHFPLSIDLLFAIFYLLLIRSVWLGELGGTFKAHQVPEQYIHLKNLIASQDEYFKTLWIPQRQRYGFDSKAHPAVSASEIFNTQDPVKIVKELSRKLKKNELDFLKQDNIRYIIVPFDSQKELFIEDRKYSEKVRSQVIFQLDSVLPANKHTQFPPIAIYELR